MSALNQQKTRFENIIQEITGTSTRLAVESKLEKAVRICEDFEQEKLNIGNNNSLSAAGKSEQIMEASRRAKEKLMQLDSENAYKDMIDRVLADIPADEFEPVLRQLKDMEVRNLIANKKEELVKIDYEKEIAEGDTPLVLALESDPFPRDFVTDETRMISRLARIAKKNPDKYLTVLDYNKAHEAWSNICKLAMASI